MAPAGRASVPRDVVDALIQSGVAEHRRILLELEAIRRGVDDPDALFARVRSVAEVELPKILAGTGELRLLAAKPTLLESRKTAAAALRYPTSPVTTYFILPGKDLPMPTEGRVQIEQYRPHMREVNGSTSCTGSRRTWPTSWCRASTGKGARSSTSRCGRRSWRTVRDDLRRRRRTDL